MTNLCLAVPLRQFYEIWAALVPFFSADKEQHKPVRAQDDIGIIWHNSRCRAHPGAQGSQTCWSDSNTTFLKNWGHPDGWWIPMTRRMEVRMRNKHFHVILLLHGDGFFVVMTTRLLGKTHFFTAYRRSVFSETAWQSPGSYRQVSSLKHPLYSCERSPRAVSNTEEDSSAVTLDFKQSSQNMTDTDIQYATHNLTNTFMSKQSTYEWKDSFRCLAEFG